MDLTGSGPEGDERSMAVQLRGLVKRFGQVVAVAGADPDVRRGSCFGLPGPDGAGKTTWRWPRPLRPDAGGARVDGVDIWAQPLLACSGRCA